MIIPIDYSVAFKVSYLLAIVPTLLVVISAFLSSKALGGSLGQGLKKIAFGSIVQTIIFATFLVLEHGYHGFLDDQAIKVFFIGSGTFGSLLLILGYIQIYKIAKRFKLFTP